MSSSTFERVTLDSSGKVVMDYTTPAPSTPEVEAYPLAMPRSAMYGRAGEWADLIQGPDGPAYLSIIAIAASNDISCSVDTIIPRIYAAHLGPIRVGKSTCINRAEKIVPKKGNIIRQFPASLPGLAKILHPGTGKDAPDIHVPHYVPQTFTFAADELEPMLQALKTPGSGAALDGALRSLWTQYESGSGDKKGGHPIKANISIIGALPVANAREFSKMFGAGTRGGLHDRFLFSVFPDRWKWNHLTWKAPVVDGWHVPDAVIDISAIDDKSAMDAAWTPPAPRDPRPAPFSTCIKVPDFVEPVLHAWIDNTSGSAFFPDEKPVTNRDRLAEQAMRVAVITASCNGDSEITRECLDAALRFAEWQERIQKVYQPALSDDKFDQFVSEIKESLLMAQKNKPRDYYLRWRELSRKNHWYDLYSRAVMPMKAMLIKDGFLERKYIGKDEFGKPQYDDNQVRWNEE